MRRRGTLPPMVSSPATAPPDPAPAVTRIVGLGASAGGLHALEDFFKHVPPQSGLAFVVVQHLDPTKTAMLAELLQRITPMPVRQAVEMMVVEPDCVYVIAPNTELGVAGGALKITVPAEPRGLRLPINVLFSSLARAQREGAIAVVLSGMGSDGTLGLQAIKALGGLTLVQQPESAQFDAMPISAIASGCADIVAPAAELPARILAYVARLPAPPPSSPIATAGAGTAPPATPLNDIFALLRQRTRHDFSLYKSNTVNRRIERRMAIHSIATLALYANFLRQNTQEIDLLFKELLIGVTSFFRDAAVWRHLADITMPELLIRQTKSKKLRAWVAGCSTGEEAYSLAMVFAELIERLPQYRDRSLQIFASDLSPDAIASARRGTYPAAISADVSPDRLARFFTAHDGAYRIDKNIRDSVLFVNHDVVLDPPFTRLDLLFCRNLMIYFDLSLQRRLLPLFHYSLAPGGVLLLGSAESVGKFNRLFTPIEAKLRLYLRESNRPAGGPNLPLMSYPPLSIMKKEIPVSPPDNPASSTENLQKAADHVLLQVHAPPAVVVSDAGDIVYISGRTGNYLEPAAGKANWNFHAMVREGLRSEIGGALKQAALQSEPVLLRDLQVQTPGGLRIVDVNVRALREPSVLQGKVMVVFREREAAPAGRGRRRTARGNLEASHAADLQRSYDEIQSLREEAHASNEELQSTNEELQSTNEELQSTNEELTTSKEEMQSMNEELQTINAEMQNKLDDLALAQSDMKNLLNSTDIAILFLDQDLNVRRFTDLAANIISLREADIGRPVSDLTTSLEYPALNDDARETLRTLVFSEKQIASNDGRWFSVRIIPYRRLDNVIDGAVITFVDITVAKALEAKLRKESTP